MTRTGYENPEPLGLVNRLLSSVTGSRGLTASPRRQMPDGRLEFWSDIKP